MRYLIKRKIKKYRPDILIKKFYKIARDCNNYYSPKTYKYYLFLLYYLRCFIIGELNVRQVFTLGLGSSFVSRKNILKYSALKKVPKIYDRLSPRSWRHIQRKGIFYIFCKNLGLPIPKLYAVIFKNHASISYINSSLIKIEDLPGFIKDELPTEFVIKPNMGSLGRGVNTYAKTNKGIVDDSGNLKTEQEIIKDIFNNRKIRTDSFIVQERLKNHPEFLKLYPSDNLHNIRLMTLIKSSGKCNIFHGHLQIATDHHAASQQGNLRIKISLNDGSLDYGVLKDNDKGGFEKVTRHPVTGQEFKDFKIPFWKEVLAFADEAAMKLLPLRTLGWDIAITEKGVVCIETNVPYGPPYYFMPPDEFVKILTEDS